MIRVKIAYLFFLLGLLFFSILYTNYYPVLFLVLALVLPIVLFIIIFNIRKNVMVQIDSLNSIGNKNEKISFEVSLKNNSKFPISNCEISLSYYNNFNDSIENEYIVIPADAGSTQTITCNIISKHCGNIMINIDKIKIYDYIKLFSLRKKVNCRAKVCVLPEIYNLDININKGENEVSVDSMSFSKFKSGDDPSEVFNIREYKAGDKLQRIHWKLSTKQQEIMVKEFSLSLNSDCILFLEFYCEKDSLSKLESLVETTISLSKFLLINKYFHYISWYSNENEEFYKIKITSEEELFEAINLIMLTKPYYTRTYTLKYHNSLNDNEEYSHIFYITSKLSKECSVELNELTSKKTLLYINDNTDNEYLKNIALTGIDVLTINTEKIKESLDKLNF